MCQFVTILETGLDVKAVVAACGRRRSGCPTTPAGTSSRGTRSSLSSITSVGRLLSSLELHCTAVYPLPLALLLLLLRRLLDGVVFRPLGKLLGIKESISTNVQQATSSYDGRMIDSALLE